MIANSPLRQRGVGLVEILVAVLILSIGLLGIGWVQTRALANNNSSMARSAAVIASYSILDAMRADRENAIDNAYDIPTSSPIKAGSCDNDADTLAEAQLDNWCIELGNIQGAVDSTTGLITCDDAGACDVVITFDDGRVGAGGNTTQTVTTRGML